MTFWVGIIGLIAAVASGAGRHPDPLQAYALDPVASHLVVVTHRSGLLGFLGHDHAIIPQAWTGTLCLGDPPSNGSYGTLAIRTAALVIDADSARALAGLGGGPDAKTRGQIQRKMLDPEHLDADRFPMIRIAVIATGPALDGRIPAQATVTLHGVTRRLALPVRLSAAPGGALELSGTLRLRQTDFGIRPESIAGVVKVSDRVDLEYALVARPEGRSCPAGSPAQ